MKICSEFSFLGPLIKNVCKIKNFENYLKLKVPVVDDVDGDGDGGGGLVP